MASGANFGRPDRDEPSSLAPPENASDASAAYHSVIYDQHHYRTDDCHEHAVEIETGDALRPNQAEQETTDDAPNNSQHDIEDHTFARLIDDLASDETSYQAQTSQPMIDMGTLLPR
jgi:hypothetical protein